MKLNTGRRRVAVLSALALSIGLFAGPAHAEDPESLVPVVPAPTPPTGSDEGMVNELEGLWLVELESAPTVEGTAASTIRAEHRDFRQAAGRLGLEYEERMEFDTLWNGLSIEMDSNELAKLQRTEGVKAIYPMISVEMPKVESGENEPDLATALQMTGADIAQSELGLEGTGIRVAIMDSGIDYEHPDLGGPGPFPTDRVVAGYDLVGDDFNAAHPDHLVPEPDDDPMDCGGHGTHVTGIVGAQGQVTGVAPDVVFGAYRVFGCEGSTTADIMIQAMELALADDMDVLNMSIGSAFSWPQYPTATASDRLVDAGMVVVASIGNSGTNGLYAAGAPGLGKNVIGVAAYDNTHIAANTFEVEPGGEQVPYLTLGAVAAPPTEGTTPELTYVGRACPSMGDQLESDPDGKVALIIRGDCAFEEKYATAVAAGAAGVVIYNNLPGLFAGGGVVDRGVFGVGISNADGLAIRDLIDAGEAVTITWTDEAVNAPNPTGGLISAFSSYGLAADLSLKPDIGAPGGLINSTYPLALGGYATSSGTSMSAPHVAGGVALLLEARPELKAHQVRSVLQNSADPTPWWGNPGLGFLDNVHRQGAGMLDIVGAVEATAELAPGKLALGATEGAASKGWIRGQKHERVKLTNTGSEPVRFTLSHEPALGTHGSTFQPGFNDAFAEVSFSKDEVVLGPGRSTNIRATITAPDQSDDMPQTIFGGYVVATADDEDGTQYRVPYAGYLGDYLAIDAVQPGPNGLPWLSRLTQCSLFMELTCIEGGSYENQPDGAAYTMDTSGALPDVPYVLVHLEHQVRKLDVRVLNAETGRPWLPGFDKAIELDYVSRNSAPTAFNALPWDGTVTFSLGPIEVTRPVPNGDYILEVRTLKALGSAHRAGHWETWQTPVVTVDRPDPS